MPVIMSKDDHICPLGADRCPVYDEIERLNSQVKTLQQQVIRDPLTGLFNKRHYIRALATEMERSRRSRLPTSLILLDIDHFKAVNDRYGHVAGDRVLERFARSIEETVRRIDIPCRYGGEEFAIILLSTPLQVASQIAERLRQEIATTRITVADDTLTVTASLGVTCYEYNQKATPADLTERADQQLYLAKQQGRNCVRTEPSAKPPAQLTEDEKAALFGIHDSTF